MKQATTQSGYIGLLGILLGAAILIFVMVKVYLTPNETVLEFQPTNVQGVTPVTQYQRNKTTIDKVNAITGDEKVRTDEINRLISEAQ